jgi:hypothetical protein
MKAETLIATVLHAVEAFQKLTYFGMANRQQCTQANMQENS